MGRETVSKLFDPVRQHVSNPLVLAAGLGLLGAGAGALIWPNAAYTFGSIGRYPIRKMTGMSADEYDEALDELATDSRYNYLVPAALGTIAAGGYLSLRANPNQKNYGLTAWAPKTASLHKEADELWTYGSYVPNIEWDQVINANDAREMADNDPRIASQTYVKHMYDSIINNSAMNAGYANPTLRDVYQSTASKIKSKLSWQGVTGVAANTMLANATAHLFTSALGAVMPLSKETKRNLIDAGTWATAIKSILT